MKLLRTSAPLLAFITIALLAACGGGGGGGSVTPPGGGGGGTPPPTSPPSASPSSSPTASPSSSPSVSPSPSPSAGPISANLNDNAAAGYDGPVANPQQGYQNGLDGWFKTGSTVPGDTTDGDTATGGIGTNTIDGNITCALTVEPTTGYHVNGFIGILVTNGSGGFTEYTVPDAIGMLKPSEPSGAIAGGQIVNPAPGGCFYQIHTHSESGLIHFEDPSSQQIFGTGSNTAKYSLQNVLHVWGVSLTDIATAIGQGGSPQILFGTPGRQINGNDEVISFNSATDPSQIMFSRHSAVWLIWGGLPSGGPPPVVFETEN